MEINEYEAGMLDAVLEGFAGREELDWTELLELFDGDEELAGAITAILAGNGLVIKIGEESPNGLPEKITLTDAAVDLMKAGGVTARFKEPVPAPEPISEQREIVFEIENKIPEAQPSVGGKLIEQIESKEPHPDVLLHQEIAQMRFDQRNFEHQLREKDIVIQMLHTQKETLGRFRLFIWVLLGLIALLIAGLVFRSRI